MGGGGGCTGGAEGEIWRRSETEKELFPLLYQSYMRVCLCECVCVRALHMWSCSSICFSIMAISFKEDDVSAALPVTATAPERISEAPPPTS